MDRETRLTGTWRRRRRRRRCFARRFQSVSVRLGYVRPVAASEPYRLPLPVDATAPSQARRAVGERLRGRDIPDTVIQTAQLLTSELVTHSVRRGADRAGSLTLELHVGSGSLRVEIHGLGRDGGSDDDREEATGWGLLLVEQLADRWGIEVGDETVPWFEVDVPLHGVLN
jgi:hypothetical protein